MRIEVTIAKTSPLPAGAIDALAGELSLRIQHHFTDNEGNDTVLQETWESADDWFINE